MHLPNERRIALNSDSDNDVRNDARDSFTDSETPNEPEGVQIDGRGHNIPLSVDPTLSCGGTVAIADFAPVSAVGMAYSSPETEEEAVKDSKNRPRVHFYDRVRIRGLSHSGRTRPVSADSGGSKEESPNRNTTLNTKVVDITPRQSLIRSGDTSTSSSYSSTISVPLRSSSDVPSKAASVRIGHHKRKPLSSVISSQDANTWLRTLSVERHKQRKARAHREVDERSPLLDPPVIEDDLAIQGRKDVEDGAERQWPWTMLTIYYWEARLSILCGCPMDTDE